MTVQNWFCVECNYHFRSRHNCVNKKCPSCKEEGTLSFTIDPSPRIKDGRRLRDAMKSFVKNDLTPPHWRKR